MILILSACAPTQSTVIEVNPSEPEINQTEAVQPVDTAPVATSLEFMDATGRKVSLPNFPERIVVAGKATPYVLDTIYLFPDAAKKLAALEVRGFDTQAFLELADPNVTVKNMLERDAGPEQIAPHQPDLVIVKNISLGQLGAALEEISIPVMGLTWKHQHFSMKIFVR